MDRAFLPEGGKMPIGIGTAILTAAGIGAAASLFGGHRHGGQTVQKTADWRTPEQKRDAQRLWNEFIDDFYGVSPKISPVSTTGIDPRIRRSLFKQFGIRNAYPNLANLVSPTPNLAGQAPEEALTEPKSYKQRLEENLTYLKGVEEAYKGELDALGAGYLTKTQEAVSPYQEYLRSLPGYVTKAQEAVSPYQQQLTNVLGQLQGGYGLGTPVSFGFGGQRVASFVPRQSRELATQQLEIGQQGMQTRTGLVDLERALAGESAEKGMQVSAGLADLERALAEAAAKRGFDFSQKHTPNEIADAYSKVLEELMWKMNAGQQTTTGTIPGTSTWHDILSGVGVGADLYSRMYPWGVQGQPTINIVPSSTALPTNIAPSSYHNLFFTPFPTKSF